MASTQTLLKAAKPASQLATKINPTQNLLTSQASKTSPLIKPYYQEAYTSLPPFEDANAEFNAKNGKSCVKFLLRPIFHRHGVHNQLGAGLIHRQFHLKPTERLVNFNGVATPWTYLSHGHFLGRKMSPIAWCLDTEGNYIPYEFAFGLSKSAASLELGNFSQFLEEFRDALKSVGLERTIGLRALLEEGANQDRTTVNVSSPLLEAKDQGASVQTTWFFK